MSVCLLIILWIELILIRNYNKLTISTLFKSYQLEVYMYLK